MHDTIPFQQRGDQHIVEQPGVRQVRRNKLRRAAGLQYIVGMIDCRQSLFPGQPNI